MIQRVVTKGCGASEPTTSVATRTNVRASHEERFEAFQKLERRGLSSPLGSRRLSTRFCDAVGEEKLTDVSLSHNRRSFESVEKRRVHVKFDPFVKKAKV